MRFTDLDLRDLLEFKPGGGVIRFGGQRVVIMDAVALGLLRAELIRTVGVQAARGVLTRFGFAHGWRTAEAMKDAFPWDDERQWRLAGGRLHMLEGMVVFETVQDTGIVDRPFAESFWRESYEAEQHLLQHGRSDEPVCWTLCGFASGYLSYCNGREIYCVEDRCVGAGDTDCHMVGRPREEWGDSLEQVLPFYRDACLEATLAQTAAALKSAEQKLALRRRELARVEGTEETASGAMVARSAPMRKVLDLSKRVAGVDATVLITGESGVGKERIARMLHEESPRAKGPFVAINCGAVTETLLESELFGHARGAFTGASSDRPGLFEAAQGGTILLDEIGEVSPGLQVKLLRTLQEREVRRVGENRNRSVDVRVLAATNRNLSEEVAAGRFRQDLYYRLRVVEVHIPPLRERKDDVLVLARTLLTRTAARLGRRCTGFSPQAADALLRYPWPGNVRELENAVERAVVLAEGSRVELDDLPEEVRQVTERPSVPAAVPGAVRTLDEVEREYILAALKANDGNQVRTAAQLGIGTATLYRKLKRYGREALE